MQTEHLFELTYILLDRKSVTAGAMAEHFGVSKRTIYRWVDALNLAGVPVITSKGKGGGISLSEKYALDKAVLTEDEKLEILSSVQALEVLSGNSSAAVSKLKAITKTNADWIKVDFAPWNTKANEIREFFNQLKSAILMRHIVNFDYYSAKGEIARRTVEPWKIVFKGQAWYLYAYCCEKNAARFFKLARMQNCVVTNALVTHAEEDFSDENYSSYEENYADFESVKLLVNVSSIYMILDEYAVQKMEDLPGKSNSDEKIVTLKMPKASWLINWVLSFGSSVKVIEPEWLKTEVLKEAEKIRY